MKRCWLALLLLALGCHSGSTPPPPPARASFTLHWSESNLAAPMAPGGSGWLTGYIVTRDGSPVANLGLGVTTYTDQTTPGAHTWQVYDSYVYTGSGSVIVRRLTVQGVAQ